MASFLVTGGAGFIGSHIVEALVQRGDRVRVLDNLLTGKAGNIAAFRGRLDFIQGDIRQLATCRRAVEGMEHVLHQAAAEALVMRPSPDWVLISQIGARAIRRHLGAPRKSPLGLG